jgi:acyl carrier protein
VASVSTLDDLIDLVRDELGLSITPDQAAGGFDLITGWDSVHLLWLAGALERTTGHTLSFADLLEASSLKAVYELAAAG